MEILVHHIWARVAWIQVSLADKQLGQIELLSSFFVGLDLICTLSIWEEFFFKLIAVRIDQNVDCKKNPDPSALQTKLYEGQAADHTSAWSLSPIMAAMLQKNVLNA